jgi:hypothetical protein
MKKRYVEIAETQNKNFENLPADILFLLSKCLTLQEYEKLRKVSKDFYVLPAIEKKVILISCKIFEDLSLGHSPRYTRQNSFDTYNAALIFQRNQIEGMYNNVVSRDVASLDDLGIHVSVHIFVINHTEINIWFSGRLRSGTVFGSNRWRIYERSLIRTPRMTHPPSPEDGMTVVVNGLGNRLKYVSMHDRDVGWFTEQSIKLCHSCTEHWVNELYVKFDNEDDFENYERYCDWATNEFKTILDDPYKKIKNTKFVKFRSFGYRHSRVGISSIVLSMPSYRQFRSMPQPKSIIEGDSIFE